LKKNVNTVLIICFYFQTAAGSLEVLFVEDQVNSENITSMTDIQNNFQTNLEAKLFKLAETMDLSRAQVDDMLEKLTTNITTIPITPTNTTSFTITTIVTTTVITTTMSTTSKTTIKVGFVINDN
jgi:hypothetical protein